MKRTSKLLSALLPLLAVPTLATPAEAAFGPDLGVVVVQSGSSLVGTPTHIDVQLTNTGNRPANATWVSIQLPKTMTSPNAVVMGTLSNVPSYCARQTTRLYCNLSSPVARSGGTAVIGFDIAMPVSSAPLSFRVDTGANNEQNLTNNTAHFSPTQSYYSPAVAPAGSAVTNSHCTGKNLTSYFECTVYTGALSSHLTTLSSDGTIDWSANGAEGAGMGGTWSVTGSQLTMQYLDNGQGIGDFIGYGSSNTCWDGKMTFPNSTFLAMYRVCM